MIGKLPINMQKKYILSRVGAKDEAVITGAGVGEDAAVIRIANNLYLVTHTDPITETSSMAGRLAMQVSSNDLATKGIRPRWAL
ncbi:MAG: hydrogenase assembly protein HupF, partial [Nitrososphaerota archaeon]|nr:hydrogenase assembly protein HupF [Nitrososphaerota archaeon]